MRSLGLDIGDKRTGVAVSDPQGILALPLSVIGGSDEEATIDDILKLIKQYEAECVVVGLPYSLNGNLGQQANKVTSFAEKLSSRTKRSDLNQVNIQLWDERLSTIAAERLMTEAGTKRNKRKQHRDAIAAAFILQGFLDSLRR
ncbi:MAG: Holliday junction resolvase RuvX [Dehalococcoidia bacterium]|nr:Holliday junction resolvase RuvX [Dehalococcoidia bacterium]